MNILVCIKQTFDTEARISLENGKVIEDDVQLVLNPYDEYAVEEAIQLKETHGGEVTVITIGPARVEEAIRTALAMGADEAIHVEDETAFGDEFTVSEVLARTIQDLPYDMILTGNQAVDDGSGQVAVRLAELLGIPHIATVVKVEIEGNEVIAHRDAEGDTEVVSVQFPVLLTAQQGLNEPRYPSLLGIRKAGKKQIQKRTLSDLGLQVDDVLAKATVIETYLPPAKSAGRILEGDTSTRVQELLKALRQTSKVL